MIQALWLLPTLAVAAAIASGRCSVSMAALLGLLVAVPVAVFAGPAAVGADQLMTALARGSWIGVTIAPYILGGLLFWQVAMPAAGVGAAGGAAEPAPAGAQASILLQRRQIFFACFLVGPFAESATGFGVGMLGTVALIRGLSIAPRHLMVLALMSQTLIPWGGMGSGTLLAAAYARMPGSALGLYSMAPVALLMLVWLPLYWRTARQAGFAAPAAEGLRESAWIAAGLGLLAAATYHLGPETALLAAYGPLIVLYYLIEQRPGRRQALATARRMLPYALLIGGLVLSRLLPGLKTLLVDLGRVAPFDNLPAWSPLFHAGSWLIVGALITAGLRGRLQALGQEVRTAWTTGKHAVLTVFLFAMMAEVLSGAGISQAFADRMFAALDQGAVLLAPLLSGAFGILANSGNAPNSLFMPSQLALAIQAGLSVPAVAALQHVSGTSLSLFSPVRMAIAASLANGRGQERAVYASLLPFAALGFALLTAAALAVVLI